MKSLKLNLKPMVKKDLKTKTQLIRLFFIFPVLIITLLFSGCSGCKDKGVIPPTYTRENLQESIQSICKKDYNLEVTVSDLEETIWIYSPFPKIINDKKEYDEK